MEEKSGGLSKGCLIGIIIASALLFLVIVTGVTCYIYSDELAKWAATFSSEGLKGEVARNPEIVDTVRFNAFIDAFILRVKADSLNKQKYADFMIAMQSVPKWVGDKMLDSSEIQKISDAMVNYFPDLDSLHPISAIAPAAVDSSGIPADSSALKSSSDTSASK